MTLTPAREVLAEAVVLCNVRRHAVQTVSDTRHTYWDETYGVPGLESKSGTYWDESYGVPGLESKPRIFQTHRSVGPHTFLRASVDEETFATP